MAILRKIEKKEGHQGPDLMIFCPACKCGHGIWITEKNSSGAQWTWNGSFEKPTFQPSLLIAPFSDGKGAIKRCHSIVTDGLISFCPDSQHELAGKTVPLEDF